LAEEIPAPGLWDWTPQPRLRGAGRPEHEPTVETTRRVVSLLALNHSAKEVAVAIGVSVPTLRKKYFSDPRIRAARLVLKGELMAALVKSAVDGGNVSANDKLWKRIEKAALKELGTEAAHGANRPPKAPKLGKKDQAAKAAKDVRGRYGRRSAPPQPSLLNPSGNA
jgi:hypothetical protein